MPVPTGAPVAVSPMAAQALFVLRLAATVVHELPAEQFNEVEEALLSEYADLTPGTDEQARAHIALTMLLEAAERI